MVSINDYTCIIWYVVFIPSATGNDTDFSNRMTRMAMTMAVARIYVSFVRTLKSLQVLACLILVVAAILIGIRNYECGSNIMQVLIYPDQCSASRPLAISSLISMYTHLISCSGGVWFGRIKVGIAVDIGIALSAYFMSQLDQSTFVEKSIVILAFTNSLWISAITIVVTSMTEIRRPCIGRQSQLYLVNTMVRPIHHSRLAFCVIWPVLQTLFCVIIGNMPISVGFLHRLRHPGHSV